MSIAYVTKKQPKKRTPIAEFLFPKKIRETRCPECGRPFLEYPDREPHHRFDSGNVELFLYEDKVYLRKEYRLRMGVWQKNQDSYHYSQLFSREYFDDLRLALAEAIEFVERCEQEENEKRKKRKE